MSHAAEKMLHPGPSAIAPVAPVTRGAVRALARDSAPASTRLAAIDAVRGLAIMLMVLDHTRDFFSNAPSPTDLTRTYPALFFTRWVTHFCAPTFLFLAGTSAFFVGKRSTRAALQRYLLSRGAWLVLLEFTLVNFLWHFNLRYSMGLVLQVIWAIGVSMCVLAGLVMLPRRILLGVSLVGIAGHNLLDTLRPEHFGAWGVLWKVLHVQGPMPVGFVHYPLIPWVFVMALGFCAGELYELGQAQRQRMLWIAGGAACATFLALRTLNVYGDPKPWATQATTTLSVLSFFNVSKYPPSLDYLLIMLGLACLLLAWCERVPRAALGLLLSLGRVPLFAYVLHLALVHLFAGLLALAMGLGTGVLTQFFLGFPKGWGVGLAGVYCAWLLVLALLVPACRWFGAYKRNHQAAWLSYC
jgi:uncharacterized membrane protein